MLRMEYSVQNLIVSCSTTFANEKKKENHVYRLRRLGLGPVVAPRYDRSAHHPALCTLHQSFIEPGSSPAGNDGKKTR
jgi:hypothetical protein